MGDTSQKKKILIVDDDQFFIEFESAFLQRGHFELLTARNGRDALDIMRNENPDLVLMDLYMPEMGGLEVIVRARAEGMIEVPIIIVSKEEDRAKSVELREAGATDFLEKPVKIEELLDKINLYLNESGRSAKRLPVTIKLRYRTLDELLTGESKDLSTTGIYVRTKKKLEVGGHVELFLYRAEDPDAEPIRVMGEVVRNSEGDEKTSGAALKFINLEPYSVKVIEKMLEDERKRAKVDIMVVDDDAMVLEMMYDTLTDKGWVVGKFESAIEALKNLDRLNPSIILADIMMPGMDGIEFCETFRKNANHGDVPFIFVSGKVDKDTLLRARASGATFFIAKPFDTANLVSKVKELIGEPQPPPG